MSKRLRITKTADNNNTPTKLGVKQKENKMENFNDPKVMRNIRRLWLAVIISFVVSFTLEIVLMVIFLNWASYAVPASPPKSLPPVNLVTPAPVSGSAGLGRPGECMPLTVGCVVAGGGSVNSSPALTSSFSVSGSAGLGAGN